MRPDDYLFTQFLWLVARFVQWWQAKGDHREH